MITGKPGEWYQNEFVGGYFDKDGLLQVCEEYGTDRDFDRYASEVMNGQGYYDDEGRYRDYGQLKE